MCDARRAVEPQASSERDPRSDDRDHRVEGSNDRRSGTSPDPSPPTRAGPIHLAILGSILVAFFAARWPFRSVPLVRDEGEYAHLGLEILGGAIPYLDVYNQKTPFVFYWMSGVQWLFPDDLVAIRLATTLWLGLSALALYAAALHIVGRRAALWAVAAFCLIKVNQGAVFHAASTETFMLGFLAAGLWAAHARAEDGPVWRWWLAGLCAGLAFQTKQTGIVFLGFLVIERMALRPPRAALGQCVWIVSGFASVFAVVIAGFAAAGALDAYLECVFANNVNYVRGGSGSGPGPGWGALVASLVFAAGSNRVLWLGGVLGLAWLARSRGTGRWLWGLPVLFGVIAAVGGRLHPHYLEPLVVPLAIGVGALQAELGRRLRDADGWRRAAWVAAVALLWIHPLQPAIRTVTNAQERVGDSIGRLSPAATALEAARFVRERSEPGERILVVGSEPQIYFYADRRSSARMAFAYPMTGPYPHAEALRERFLRNLEDDGPRWVIVCTLVRSLAEDSAAAAAFRDQVSDALDDRYRVERVLPEGLLVYRRVDAPDGP